MTDSIIGLAIIVLFCLAFLLTFILVKEIKKQNYQSQLKKNQSYSSKPVSSKPVQRPLVKIIPKQRQKISEQPVKFVKSATTCKLLSLVNGEMETAKRLVVQAREKNPDKSEQWCWEKVIHDLERDRRA